MKKILRMSLVTIVFSFLMTMTIWANELNWETAPGHHDQSVLLDSSVTSSEDSIHQYGRGEYLAEGSVEIRNPGDGSIYLRADTLAYVCVDRILHHIFLDYWDEDYEDWVQVGYWEFEELKEKAYNGELYHLSTTMTLTGHETGLYYRVRGLHGVEYNDEFEACATESNGVLITNN